MEGSSSNYLAIFKECISMACTHLNVDHGRFARDRGLRDVMIEIFAKPFPPKEIAARALDGLCHRDRSEYDSLVMAAIIEFLNLTTRTDRLQDPSDGRKFADLKQAMQPGSGYLEILAFLKAWYA